MSGARISENQIIRREQAVPCVFCGGPIIQALIDEDEPRLTPRALERDVDGFFHIHSCAPPQSAPDSR